MAAHPPEEPSLLAEWSKTAALGLQVLFVWWRLRKRQNKTATDTKRVIQDTATEQKELIKAQTTVIQTQNALIANLRKEVEKNTNTQVILSDKYAETNDKVHQVLGEVKDVLRKQSSETPDPNYHGPKIDLDPKENPGSVTAEVTPKQPFGKVIRKD